MVQQIKKILCATDLTDEETGLSAAQFVANLALKLDANVLLLHCIPRIPQAPEQQGGLGDAQRTLKELQERQKVQDIAEMKKRLQDLSKVVESSTVVRLVSGIIVKEGDAVEEILNTADAEGCDMVVLGTHRRGRLKQALLGSVARAVLERTRKPILVIPLPL